MSTQSYIIFRHRTSGQRFVVGRRVTSMPGKADTRDWVKIPVDKYGMVEWGKPQYLIGSAAKARRHVEAALLAVGEADAEGPLYVIDRVQPL